ncbi:MAG: M48 family metallopeptidase, partial [Rhodospirillales bacterium]|nr:M48 family metallopeptidase [Rhodospirillales bacterium]
MSFPRSIVYNGYKIPLRLRYNAKAKRIILRVDQETGGAIITLPPHASKTEALSLVNERVDWIVDKIKELPPKITLTDGQSLTLMGDLITIR